MIRKRIIKEFPCKCIVIVIYIKPFAATSDNSYKYLSVPKSNTVLCRPSPSLDKKVELRIFDCDQRLIVLL